MSTAKPEEKLVAKLLESVDEQGGYWSEEIVTNWRRIAGRPPYNHWILRFIDDPGVRDKLIASLPEKFEGYRTRNLKPLEEEIVNFAPRLLKSDNEVYEDEHGRLYKFETHSEVRDLFAAQDDEIVLYYHLPKQTDQTIGIPDDNNREMIMLVNLHDKDQKKLLFVQRVIPNKNRRSKSGIAICTL
jgi:hypothetical protein